MKMILDPEIDVTESFFENTVRRQEKPTAKNICLI
jgi:hypothetical protein